MSESIERTIIVNGPPIPEGAQSVLGHFAFDLPVTGIYIPPGEPENFGRPDTLVVVFDGNLRAVFRLESMVAFPEGGPVPSWKRDPE